MLVRKILKGKVREKILEDLNYMDKLYIDRTEYYDLLCIAYGIYSPLEGFLGYNDVLEVLNNVRLENGNLWSIPIILHTDKTFKEGEDVVLYYNNNPVGIINVEEIYKLDKKYFVEKLFGRYDLNHPGIRYYLTKGNLLISGEIFLLNDLDKGQNFLEPKVSRDVFKRIGWKTVAGFQTRSVPHIGHEFLIKYSLSTVDGVLISPVIGVKRRGDWRDEVVMETWKVLAENYLPKNRIFLGFIRYSMRYAGPREALHHAIMRKNLGCTHFIIGRDHAGINNYYKPYEAQEFVKKFENELDMKIISFKEIYYCKRCNMVVHEDICPHDERFRIKFSGTKIRECISNGSLLNSFREEILKIVKKHKSAFL